MSQDNIGIRPGRGMQKDTSHTPSSHGGEPSDAVLDLIEELLMEEVLSQMGASSKMPFRFTQLSRLPSVHSLSLECQWACSTTPNNWMHYCIHIRVTLGEGRGNQLPPSHVWNGLLICCKKHAQREHHQSGGPGTREGNTVL